jgi:type VI secretion system protein ImpA
VHREAAAVIDVEGLLSPVSDDAPSGPALEYDPEFTELETAARGKSEQQFGDTVIAAEEPDWRDVSARAAALLARSKDLRVAIHAARAATRMDNVAGLAAGLELIAGLTSRFWDSLHPELDHDEGDDPMMRLNALGPLADSETFLRDVRSSYLVASPQHGRVSFRDVLVADGKLPPGADAAMSAAEIAGIARAVAADDPAPLQASLACVAHVKALESFLGEKGVLTQAPDLRPLLEVLQAAAAVSAAALHVDSPDADGETEGGASEQGGRSRTPGQILTRDDAIRVLESVCRFMEQAEPANPAPLFIRRAQRLMTQNFMEIIQELAPESLGQIQKLAGLEEK